MQAKPVSCRAGSDMIRTTPFSSMDVMKNIELLEWLCYNKNEDHNHQLKQKEGFS